MKTLLSFISACLFVLIWIPLAQAQEKNTFFLAENGVTIKCPDAEVGETGMVNGVEYEAVDRALLDQRLAEDADLTKLCTSLVTDLSYFLFDLGYIRNFNQPIGNWDVSNVTNMRGLFAESMPFPIPFNQPLEYWDVSNVTDMAAMFANSRFNQDISMWNTGKVQDMSGMFYGTPFNHSLDEWNVSNVTNMESMFAYAWGFNQNIGNWDVSSVTNMSEMFWNSPFNKPIGNWNVSNVTNMHEMFYDSYFNQPIGEWDVSNVTNMHRMFAYTWGFNQNIGNWDVSNVIHMNGMFDGANNFLQNLSFWCVQNVESDPLHFATNSPMIEEFLPSWGNCPQGVPSRGLFRIEQSRASESVAGAIAGGWLFNATQTFDVEIHNIGATANVVFKATPLAEHDSAEFYLALSFGDGTVTLKDILNTGLMCGSAPIEFGPAMEVFGSYDPNDDSEFSFVIRENVTEACGQPYDEILFTATRISSSIDDETPEDHPTRISLHQNYPNPFNPTTQIRYDLPEAAEVRLEVFNVMGQRVATLVNEHQAAGVHTATFNGSGLASGVYIYRFTSGNFMETMKMVLVK